MKTKYTMMAAFLACSGVAVAQEVDDMYFNARDRVTHTEATQANLAVRYAAEDNRAVKTNPVNPSDTYTGRGVNPEYNAQQKNGAEIVQGNPDYFLASYKPKGINNNQYTSTSPYNYNCACSRPYGGYGNPYGSFYSPHGYGYSPYSMMGMGYSMYPYGYGSGWSMSMMYGMGYGMGSMYNPYGMYRPYGYYPSYSVAPAYAYDPIQNTYGRRPIRSTAAQTYAYANPGYTTGTNGRTRVAGQTRTNYYDPKWRNDPNNYPTRSYTSTGRGTSWAPSSTGRSSSWTPTSGSRTRSSFDTFGTGSRSVGSVPSGGSSSGGGRSRGRN